MSILGLSSFGFYKQDLPKALFTQKWIENDRKLSYSPLKSAFYLCGPLLTILDYETEHCPSEEKGQIGSHWARISFLKGVNFLFYLTNISYANTSRAKEDVEYLAS